MTCKSGAQTPDGGRSSLIRVNTSVTSNRLTDVLRSRALRTKKVHTLELPTEPTEPTKDGESYTLTSQQPKLRDLTKTSDSKSIDHSTSCLDYQATELLNTKEVNT